MPQRPMSDALSSLPSPLPVSPAPSPSSAAGSPRSSSSSSPRSKSSSLSPPPAKADAEKVNPADPKAMLSLLRARKLYFMNTFIERDATPALILPRLYLGSVGAATNLHFLKEHHVSHVLCIGNHLPLFHAQHFEYLHLVVQDVQQEDISQHFHRCLTFIERGRGGRGEISGRPSTPHKAPFLESAQTQTESPPHHYKGGRDPVVGFKQSNGHESALASLHIGQSDQRPTFNAAAVVSPSLSTSSGTSSLAPSVPYSPIFDDSVRAHDGTGTWVGTGVLLHCFAGRSRSVTILLAYLLHLIYRNSVEHEDVQYINQALKQRRLQHSKDVSSLSLFSSISGNVQAVRHEASISDADSSSTYSTVTSSPVPSSSNFPFVSTPPCQLTEPSSSSPQTLSSVSVRSRPSTSSSEHFFRKPFQSLVSAPCMQSHLTLQELFEFVKGCRAEIKPNAGFINQLLKLEGQLQMEKSHRITSFVPDSETQPRAQEGDFDLSLLTIDNSHSIFGNDVNEEWRKL